MRNHTSSIRSRITKGAGLGIALTALVVSSASAATKNVEATDDKVFVPGNVTQTVGSSVHWFGTVGSTTEHSVLQNQNLFSSGAPRTGLDFTRVFSAGTFAYHCAKHGLPMSGQVRVAPQVAAAPAGLSFTVKWATAGSNTGNTYDVQFRVGTGAWRTWKSNTGAPSAVFGARSAPVKVASGKSYSFRVVSRNGAAKSGISPVKSFRAS